jgi:heme a synthase
LYRYALLLSACTLYAIVDGTTVTSNDARPLYDFGQGHWWAGALVGLLTIGLAVWLARVEKRSWMQRLGWITLVGALVECLLGLPPLPQPPALRITHALLAQIFFSSTVALAVFTSPGWQRAAKPVVDASSLRTLAKLAPILALLQASLGVAHRHGAMDVLPHILGALVVVVFILIVTMSVIYKPQHEALRTAAVTLLIITCVQLFLGFALFTMGSLDIDPLVVIVVTMIHTTTAALTLAATVVMAALVWRGVRGPDPNAPPA